MLAFNHLGCLGQLGNQMFQYAALRGIAKNKGYDFIIPNHKNVFDDGIGNKIKIELFNCFKLSNLHNTGMLHNGYAPIVKEKQFHFDKELFDLCPDEISLCGFFQSEKWFKNIESSIREDFTFHDEIFSSCEEMMQDYHNAVSLHIRRGDFLINSDNHYNLQLDYYEKALRYFSDEIVIVFSDDHKWCKKQDIFSDDRFLIAEGNINYVDLCLMSMCNSHIIANSSFSWWGAWLANSKKVIAPKKWFGKNLKHNKTHDIYLDGWEII